MLISLLLFRDVVIKFLLFLLNPTMIDLLEIPLLSELIIRGASLLGQDASLIKLLLHHCELIRQLTIHSVDIWDRRQLRNVQLSLRLEFKPLLLEGVKGSFHTEFDKEIS